MPKGERGREEREEGREEGKRKEKRGERRGDRREKREEERREKKREERRREKREEEEIERARERESRERESERERERVNFLFVDKRHVLHGKKMFIARHSHITTQQYPTLPLLFPILSYLHLFLFVFSSSLILSLPRLFPLTHIIFPHSHDRRYTHRMQLVHARAGHERAR
jgi:Protein of unknown function (DUF3043)